MAPEVIKGKKHGYGKECDIWGLGCLLYETMCGKQPFKPIIEKQTLQDAILKNQVEYYKYWSPDLKDLLSKIFVNSPGKRITLGEIKEHTWMKDFDWKAVEERTAVSPLLNVEPNDAELKHTQLGSVLAMESQDNTDKLIQEGIDHPERAQDMSGEKTEIKVESGRRFSFGD